MVEIPEVTLVKVSKLKRDGDNPNEMSEEKYASLKESMKEYGFFDPIVTNKDFLIADGEHRAKAAEELGMEEVPVVALDVNEVDRKIIRQIRNKLKGEHHFYKDVDEYKKIIEAEGDLSSLNKFLAMDESETEELMKLVEDGEQINEEDAFEKAVKQTERDFVQSTFILHESQVNTVRLATKVAKEDPLFQEAKEVNSNSNAAALYVVARRFLKWQKERKTSE